jgi:hypothetical protein
MVTQVLKSRPNNGTTASNDVKATPSEVVENSGNTEGVSEKAVSLERQLIARHQRLIALFPLKWALAYRQTLQMMWRH